MAMAGPGGGATAWVMGGICCCAFASVASVARAGSIAALMVGVVELYEGRVLGMNEEQGAEPKSGMRSNQKGDGSWQNAAMSIVGRHNLPVVLASCKVRLAAAVTTAAAVAVVAVVEAAD